MEKKITIDDFTKADLITLKSGDKIIHNLQGSGERYYPSTSQGETSIPVLTRPIKDDEIINELSNLGIEIKGELSKELKKDLTALLSTHSNHVARGSFIYPPAVPNWGDDTQKHYYYWYYKKIVDDTISEE